MDVRQALGGRYTLLSELGRGGMAVVWRARDEVLGRPVAVKVLAGRFAGDPQSRARIRDEARSAATLSHPNIAQVYDYGEADEEGNPLPYVVMELVNGPTLQQRVSSGPLPPRTIFRICGEVAAALAAAHEDGLVHRDIKMANIMVTPAGVKVVDFGIAAAAGPAAPEDRLVGTPAYLAPERLTGDAVVAASDVYALGVLLYRLLAHESPWSVESTTQMLEAHVYVDPAPLPELPGVPAAVAELIGGCLRKDPAQRPTASEVSALLADAAEAASADAARDLHEPTATRLPATQLPTSGLPANPLPTSGLPASGLPAHDLSTGGLPAGGSTGGLPAGGLSMGGLPSGWSSPSGLPTSGLPLSGLPLSGLPPSGLSAGGLPPSGLPAGGLPTGGPVGDWPSAGADRRPPLPAEAPRYLAQPAAVAQPDDRSVVAGDQAGRGNPGESSRFDRSPSSVGPAPAPDWPVHGSRRRADAAAGGSSGGRRALLAGGVAAAVTVAALATWFLISEPEPEAPQPIAGASASAAPSVSTARTRPPTSLPGRADRVPTAPDAPAPGVIIRSGPVPTTAPSAARTVSPSVRAPVRPSTSSETSSSPSAAPPVGRRLETPGGAAFVTCDEGWATLTGSEPADGFTAQTIEAGPALTARVLFTGATSKYRMAVTCVGQTPTPVVLPL